VKERQVLMRVVGAMLVVVSASSLDAQSSANTQRPLRPGQTRGPAFMVPVFRSAERGLGVQVADVIRDRLMSDNLMTSMWVISKKDLGANLSLSGYSESEALSTSDLKQLAQFIRADEYVDGVVTKNGDGNITLSATLNLPRGEGMEQPLTVASGAKPGDIAARMSGEIANARKQIKGATDCQQSLRQRQYDEAKAHAAKAIKEYDKSVFARICLLELGISTKAADDELIKTAEEILTIAPENDRALEVVVDAYARKAKTDKAYEEKYTAALEKLLLADPTNTSLQASVVRALATSGKYDKAKPIIDEAVKQSPGDPELIKLQWGIYRAMGNFKGAIPIGEEMIKHDTAVADTVFYQQLVAAYLSDSQPQKAQEAAARGAAKFPNNITLWLSVAQLARRNGQLPQALEAISKVLVLDPKNSTAALQKAQIFSEQDQVDSMVVALRQAVDIGASRETASGMILNKVNPWLQRWSKDTAKTVAEGERLLGVVLFADTLNSGPASALFSGLVQLQLGQTLLGEGAKSRNCEMATKGRDYVAKSQEVLPRAGRQFPDQTAQAMNGVMQLLPYGEQVVRAVCTRPPGRSR
jgi:tetratricopeptide (TPR) repeat protein